MLKLATKISAVFFWFVNLSLISTFFSWLVYFIWQVVTNNGFVELSSFFRSLPIDIAVTFLIIFCLPFVTILSLILTKNQHRPIKPAQILFGVELPIISFAVARLIFLKTLTPVNILFLSTATLSIITYSYYIFAKSFTKTRRVVATLFLQSAVVVGLYASLLMFFFLPILLAWVINAIISVFSYGIFLGQDPWMLLTGLISLFAFFSLSSGLVLSPFIGLITFHKATSRLGQNLFRPRLYFSLSYLVLIFVLSYQSNISGSYYLLNAYRQTTDFTSRSRLATSILKQEKKFQNRLIENYLAHYRYLTDISMTALRQAYLNQTAIGEPHASRLQSFFLTLAYPFVFQGHFESDVKSADADYRLIFDEPIQLSQPDRVKKILSQSFNFSSDQLQSSVLDRTDKDVLLINRQITAIPDQTSQFATVTIEEEYDNLTSTEQEVYYLFALPPDSVITDLKLGPDLNIASARLESASSPIVPVPGQAPLPTSVVPTPIIEQNQGQVAPQAAANTVYENQYQPRIDPALLDQVGPSVYQLRVYPIPVSEDRLSQWQRDNLTAPIRRQKVRYSYVTPINPDHTASLPQIIETRNLTGKNIFFNPQVHPISLASASPTSLKYTLNQANVVFLPHSTTAQKTNLSEKKIGLLVDSSYSMRLSDWRSFLQSQLPLDSLIQSNLVDLYFFTDLVSPVINLNNQLANPKALAVPSFGQTNRLKALKQVEGKYDLIIMFTDSSSADLSNDEPNPTPTSHQSIYLVFTTSPAKFPPNLTRYLASQQAVIAKSGQFAISLFSHRQLYQPEIAPSLVAVTTLGGWFITSKTSANFTHVPSVSATSPFAKLATRYFINSRLKLPAEFDSLNTLAWQQSIVTPISSLIVVTTPDQQSQLDQQSTSENRFKSNHQLGEETLAEPQAGGFLSGSAVPEPQETVLIFVVLLLLVFTGRRQILLLIRSHG
jgi:hypothetical protein